jgi:Flp pilus assembly pilin Flp
MAAWHNSNERGRLWSLSPTAQRRALRDQGQASTEYSVVLAVLVIALAAVILVLQIPIQSLLERVGGGIAGILP